MSDLYHRLKQIRETRSAQPATIGRDRGEYDGYLSPGGEWTQEAPGVFLLRTVHRIFPPGAITADGAWSPISPLLRLGDAARLIAIDIETTGLSGGAGNVAFLVGIAGIRTAAEKTGQHAGRPVDIALTQLFLGDFDAESRFLGELEETLAVERSRGPEPTLYVTYNGSRFDLPVLRSRFLLNRRRFPEEAHFDALHLTRRLYARRIGSCTLTNVERRVLGVERTLDVPSAEVPQRYLEYLRLRRTEQLLPVFAHHAADVINLARLALLLNEELQYVEEEGGALQRTDRSSTTEGAAPRSAASAVPDPVALARLLLERGSDPITARRVLLDLRESTERRRLSRVSGAVGGLAVRLGAQLPRDWVESRRLLIGIARRAGEFDLMQSILEEMLSVRGSIEDAEELSKFWEHRRRDPKRALEVLLEYGARTDRWSESAEYRAARLRRKRDARSSR